MNKLKIILEKIKSRNPMHYNNVRKFIDSCELEFLEFSNAYIENYLTATNVDMDYLVESYLTMVKDASKEQMFFKKNGQYRLSTTKEAQRLVYADKDYMSHYMHGLALSQFLWPQHKDIFLFFKENIKNQNYDSYLEVGTGHGLFFLESVIDGGFKSYTAVDISETSLQITKNIVDSYQINRNISYILKNIFDFDDSQKYDFVVMCEVLEHLESPVEILKKINSLLSSDGKAFFTTCANCPMVDHIYLYKNIEDIEQMLQDCGFNILEKVIAPSANLTLEEAINLKASITYGALVKKGN